MVGGCMQQDRNIALLQQRRDGIRQWLDDEAPYTEATSAISTPTRPSGPTGITATRRRLPT